MLNPSWGWWSCSLLTLCSLSREWHKRLEGYGEKNSGVKKALEKYERRRVTCGEVIIYQALDWEKGCTSS